MMKILTACKAVRDTLRFKPEKFTFGEVASGEASQMIQQLNSRSTDQVTLPNS